MFSGDARSILCCGAAKMVWRRFFALSYFAAMQYAHSRWTNPVTAADIAADLTTKGPEFDHE
jgi:hypothetical protein